MNILFLAPYSLIPYSQSGKDDVPPDLAWTCFVLPLRDLGHQVTFVDTRKPSLSLWRLVNEHRTDLVFMIGTGELGLTPHEPWAEIRELTARGIKTLHWNCDSTWRYDWERSIRQGFFAMTCPEKEAVERHKAEGYRNVMQATWHANENLYHPAPEKTIPVSFVGRLHAERALLIAEMRVRGVEVHAESSGRLSLEQMVDVMGRSTVSLNFSKDSTGRHTQQKQRLFELAACRSCIVSEYHPGMEEQWEVDKEIVTFATVPEAVEKVAFLSKKPKITERIAEAGYQRFLKDHRSVVRLGSVIDWVRRLECVRN